MIGIIIVVLMMLGIGWVITKFVPWPILVGILAVIMVVSAVNG